MREKVREIFRKINADKKLIAVIIVGMAGVVLLVISEFLPEDTNEAEKNSAEVSENDFYTYEKNLEERLTALLETIEGAGNVRVMITAESGDEKVFATESRISENDEEKNYVLIDAQGGDSGLLLKTAQPEIRGVAVVCEGADSPSVRQEITGTVTAVLGISTNRINISKMKNSDGG